MRADGTMKQIVGKYLPDPENCLEVAALETRRDDVPPH